MHELVIRNALLLDGTGAPARCGDLGISGGKIVEVGKARDLYKEEFRADGLALMPGIIDNHTHYDAQLTWDSLASPSPALGVTTAVIGNCGFTIAPCRPADRELILKNLTQVEGMSLEVLKAGTRWGFESVPDYFAMLERQGVAINVAGFVGHSSVRTYVMGEDAPRRAATPAEVAKMRDLVQLDGPMFQLGLDYFTHDEEGVDMNWDAGSPTIGRIYSEQLVELFGAAREPDGEITEVYADVAASLQAMLEEAYLHLVDTLWERTRIPNLCLAGGVALNAVANGRILPETSFEQLYVQPAAGDSGTAVGAAYYVWNQELGRPRGFVMEHAYTGPEFSDDEIRAAIEEAGVHAERLDDDALFSTVAERIAAGDVVGWFQGRMEFGPRALGHRSIVADPRSETMKDVLNARIKHREAFRPFAPSILAECVGDWYEQDYPSPFMVLVYKTAADKRDRLAAVNHVDDTGRVQSVEERIEPRYHRLISEFERQTGVPVVLNTSFNENEPIVMTPQDALDTFAKTRMDVLALGNYVVRRNGG